MKYQTFTRKSEVEFDKYCKNVDSTLKKTIEKNYQHTYKGKNLKNNLVSLEFGNKGVAIVVGHWKDLGLDFDGILCNSYIQYLGFRDTKKFNNMLKDISKSLEDICYVHTGEIK